MRGDSMKILYIFVMIIIAIFGGNKVEIQNDLVKCMSTPNQYIIYNENNKTTYKTNNNEYNKISNLLIEMCADSREMPAFGVSLDPDTRAAMESGLWIELIYTTTQEYNEMPFDKLLIQVVADYSGFNIFRELDGKYEGRCFYLSLEGDMSSLYNYIIKLA